MYTPGNVIIHQRPTFGASIRTYQKHGGYCVYAAIACRLLSEALDGCVHRAYNGRNLWWKKEGSPDSREKRRRCARSARPVTTFISLFEETHQRFKTATIVSYLL